MLSITPGQTPRAAHLKGVSLVEVVVVVALLGVLLAAVVPGAAEWMRNLKVRNAADSLQSGIQRARLEALRRNQTVTFWLLNPGAAKSFTSGCALSASHGSWIVSLQDPSGKCEVAISETTAPQALAKGLAADGAAGVTVSAINAEGEAARRVTFNSLGQAVEADAITRIQLSHDSAGARTLRVVVGAGGSVRTCDTGVAANDPRAC